MAESEVNPAASEFYITLPDGAKRDCPEWIREAKHESTRETRMETMMTGLSEGKKDIGNTKSVN
jgi:uncharacterized protein YdeI (YjbR/CyaY-like superfamily)